MLPPISANTITGYHATSSLAARTILNDKRFRISINPDDWLGHGVYFWEGETRAKQWAKERFGLDGTILKLQLSLRRCLDLTDATQLQHVFAYAHSELSNRYHWAGKRFPENDGLRRFRDCLVFNRVAELLRIDSIRCPFLEGIELFPGSAITTRQHIQICIRSQSCIHFPESNKANGVEE